MKTILLAISLALFTLQATGQSFTRSQVYDSLTLTGQNNKVTLFDYDGDGDDDVFSYGGTNDNRILVFENNNGNFDSSFVFYESNFDVKDITFIDFDNDGDFDIIANDGGILIKFENIGSGNYTETALGSLGISTLFDNYDVDNDGISDLVFQSNSNISWIRGLGSGNFETASNILFTVDDSVVSFEMADLNNNGESDFIVQYEESTNTNSSAISFNDGNGNFTTTNVFPVPSGKFNGGYSLGDFNNDGLIDLAYADRTTGGGKVIIIWNDPNNDFDSSSVIKDYTSISGLGAETVKNFDFDNDGNLDLLIGENFWNTDAEGVIFVNNGGQNFTEHSESIKGARWGSPYTGNQANNYAIQMFFSDFDSDGNIDILTNSFADSDIILHQQSINADFLAPVYLNHFFEGIHSFDILDYNNDNNLDLVTITNKNGGKLEVAHSNGNNEFTSSEVLIDNRTAFGAKGSQLTFWNNNTDYDLIFSSSNKVFVHLDFDTPNESVVELFTSNPSNNTGNIGYANDLQKIFTIGDIDNDGDNDLVIPQLASTSNNTYYWVENTGGENFTLHAIASVFTRYLLVDVDNDDDLDFIGLRLNSTTNLPEYEFYSMDPVTKNYTNYLTLSAPANTGNTPQFAAGDIDDDGDEDIVISGLMWMENDGAGNFTVPVDLITGYDTLSNIVIDDIDNDGLLDIITNVTRTIPTRQLIAPLFNQGSNVFTPFAQELEVGITNQHAIATADLNGNGFKSIIAGSFEDVNWTPILFNFCINTENTVDVDVCSGDSYTFADGTVQDDITQDVTFVSTLTGQAANGCDVVVTENITVISVSDVTTTTTDETITANNSNATYVWLDCDDNFAVIPGETGQSFTATANGNYAVEITENGCSEISDCVLITTLGLEDNTLSNQINIYPNPTAGDLSIQLGNTYEDVQVVVRNILGQQIMTKTYTAVQDLNINIEADSGLYFIEITTGNQRAVSKVVKR